LARFEEHRCAVERCLYYTDWIVAQIENKTLQVVRRKFFDGVMEFFRSLNIPTGDADVAIAGF